MRARLLLVLLLSASACTRSFRAPRGGGPPPQLTRLSTVDAAGAFAGEQVVLEGSNFSETPELDEVRIGTARAALDPAVAPTATRLVVVMPALEGPAPGSALPVAVTVRGQASNTLPVTFLGLGHPRGLSLTAGAALAPTPVKVAVLGRLAMVSLLSNRVHVLLPNTREDQPVIFPAAPGALPYGASWTLSLDGGGFAISPGVGLVPWTSEFSFVPGANAPPHQLLRTNAFTPRSDFSLPVAAVGEAPGIEGSKYFIPLPGSLVDLGGVEPDAGVATVRLGGGRSPDALVDSASQLLFDPDAGGLGIQVVAAYRDDDGGSTLVRLELDRTGGQIRSQPLGFAPSAIALDPDGEKVWMLVAPTLQGSKIAAIDASGAISGERAAPSANLLIATRDTVITGDLLSSRLSLSPRDPDAGSPSELTLPGAPIAFARDDLDPQRFYALVDSPPSLVEVDPAGPTVVHLTPLTNDLRLLASAADGSALALAGFRLPTLVTLDARSLQPLGVFQHQAAPGEPDFSVVLSAAFRASTDGGRELCVETERALFDGGDVAGDIAQAVRCGPPEAVFENGCDLFPPAPFVEPYAALVALDDGRLRIYAQSGARDCPAGCQPCTPLPGFTPGRILASATTRSGGLVVDEEGQLRLFDGATWRVLCDGAPDCGQAGETAALAIDARETRVVLLGHQALVFALDGATPPLRLSYDSDNPLAAAFSPDSARLYVGTLLGHLDEYDLTRPPAADGRLAPVRTLFAGFPIAQVTVPPGGERVLLLENGTDRIWVVQ